MKKMMYLHGFASSGASGTVELLRREFWEKADASHRAAVVAPDIPLDPLVALPMLKAFAARERPDIIIGTSMGGMYAQQLHGFARICVNPSFFLSKKYDILFVERHYPGMSSSFPGGHRLNAHVVVHTLLPYIRSLNLF